MGARTVLDGVDGRAARAPIGWAGLWRQAVRMMEARRTRQMLAELDHRLLADVGIGPGDAQMEAARPFWDITPRRR